MRKALCLAVGLCIACSLCAQALKKYDIKSGIATIEIVMTIGKTQIKSTKIVYFDDYGVRECEETYQGNKLTGVLLCDGKNKISLDQEKKIAVVLDTSTRGTGTRIDINDMGTKKDIDSGTVKILAPMTIAGQSCEVIQVKRGDSVDLYAGWNKFMAYMKTSGSTVATEIKAVKLQANAAVPKEKFQVPAGYTVKKM